MSVGRSRTSSMVSTAVGGLLALVAVAPILWVVTTSLRTKRDILGQPLGLPRVPQWQNYVEAWTVGNFGRYFVNSLLVVVPTVLAVMVLSLLAAYAFALFSFRFKKPVFVLLLFGMTVPVGVLIIPLYYQMVSLGLLDTLWAIILPQIALGIPITTLLLRTFIETLPREIVEAARIDGCGSFRLLVRIILPLSRPALLTLTVLQFMWIWNQFLLPVVLINDRDTRTLPTALSAFLGRYSTDTQLLMAGAAISIVPVIVLYVVFQRRFIEGISSGALGGK